jgi:microcin C transport system substrate-binding protein
MKRIFSVFLFFFLAGFCFSQATIKSNYLSLRDEALYKNNFTHFNYVNPAAPKGGNITRAILGTFDNLHCYAYPAGNYESGGFMYLNDSLMVGSEDESNVLYPLIAEKVEYAANYSYFIFSINPAAKDAEGKVISAEDAAFSFTLLYEHGVPQFRSYYNGVRVSVLAGNKVRFDLPPQIGNDGEPQKDDAGNLIYSKEQAMSLAQSPVFPKRFWEGRDFSKQLTSAPLSTGPYRVGDFKMGQYIIYERVKDYWAADLPVNKGRYNFDTLRFDYYRDANVAFEAFKAGNYDFRQENSAKNWATQYTGKWIETQHIILSEIKNEIAQSTQGLVYNVQRPIFSDRRVRLALAYFFDFEWMNKNLFYSSYMRTRSYFQNTIYEAKGLPDASEIKILNPIKNLIPSEVYTKEYNPPVTDGTGNIREQAREALAILKEAGWELKNGKLVNSKNEQFSFELLTYSSDTERFAIPFQRNLARFGIDMRIRTVDDSQFINRFRAHDFDMLAMGYSANQTPSADLMIVWHTKFIENSYNLANVSDKAVDYLTEQITANQEDGEALLALGRAFDRVLTWNGYLIPEWNLPAFRLAYKDSLAKPDISPKYSVGIETWWCK